MGGCTSKPSTKLSLSTSDLNSPPPGDVTPANCPPIPTTEIAGNPKSPVSRDEDGKKSPFFPWYSPSPAHYLFSKKSPARSPAYASSHSTPRRLFKRPFPPPSPAKHIKSLLARRHGTVKPNEASIPEGTESETVGVTGLDKSFGFLKNFGNKYEIGEEVGRGHFGFTRVAVAKKGDLKGQKVAVKIIPKAKMTTAIAIEDVRREVKILRGLTGLPNLIRFFEAYEDSDSVYIVMELCQGGELLDRILSRGGKYTEEDAKVVMAQILNFVACCHLQGVVHRDLKPENFLFTSKEEDSLLKAIDFGLSDFVKPDEKLNDIVGSAYYVAPEVLLRSYTTEADVWSVGVIAYIILCGSRPFWARTESEIFKAVLKADPSFDEPPWPTLSFEAKDFVKRLLNKGMDDMNLIQSQRHHIVVRELGEEIDLEIGPGDDETSFANATLISGPPREPSSEEHDESKQMGMTSQLQGDERDISKSQPVKRKKKVVKRWREEWADTYKWAYLDMKDGTGRIFCSVCREYGRKHRRNPYGNEGSRNMQMSALEEHNNSLLHKEALRLQIASREKPAVDKPMYAKALMSKTAGSIVDAALKRDPYEVEFIQSVQEAVHAIERVIAKNSHYVSIMERLLEPERTIIFRVPWVDDRGETHVNRGFRVQFNQALGPCRGGIRFHPTMNLSLVKFLAFEQTLKNALSPYKLGGAAGGSDFDPKGKSDGEIMRFCQSFMTELYRYLGPDQDLPSEEMGVGAREMGYLFGQYRRLAGQFQGSLTGPRICWSGTSLRAEATGYGLVFFAQLILADMNRDLKGLRCVVSGSGKIALHVAEKLLAYGAIPITVSDSKGCLVDEDGFDFMKVQFLRDIKAQQRSLRDYSKTYARSKYYDEAKPWNERCDIAFPCAIQNEIDQVDAVHLVNSGCHLIVEGSNMPCTPEAVDVLRKANVIVAPSMAAGAGGVAAGELELNHEFNLLQWSPEDFESKLQEAMKQTYQRAIKAASDFGYQKESPEALVNGAAISAFLTISQSMTDQGCV